ncbi:MAG: sulfotransferase [Woeseiaceae bacterium]|nr:sulfotransferase [Woeseiaceae bacterium]
MNEADTKKLIEQIHEAARLLRGDNRSEALLIYHDVKERSEGNPVVEMQLGHLCEEFGDIDEAIMHYEIVVEHGPDNAQSLSILGKAYLQAHELDKAHEVLEKAIEIDPDIVDAQHALGVFYMRRLDHENAIGPLERACELRPRDVGVRINLAATLDQLNRHDEALSNINRALQLEKKSPAANLVLTEILSRTGDMDGAQKQAEKLVKLQPQFGAAYDQLARIRKFTDADMPMIRQAEKALKHGMPAKDRCSLLFAIGKMYDDCGKYDEAWASYQQANLLRKHRYDINNDRDLVKALQRAFSAKNIPILAGNGNSSEKPVFIVGMPRSGTTLMERIIASHPLGGGAGELPQMVSAGHKMFPKGERRKSLKQLQEELTEEEVEKFTEDFLRVLEQGRGDAARIVDKMPGNSRFVGLIHVLFPNATIIHARRHPLDSCLSCYFQNFAELWWTNDLQVIGKEYTLYRKSMEYWSSVLPEGTIIDVQYEQLVEDPETHARRMLDAVGLEWDPSVLEFYRKKSVVRTASMAQTRQKIYKSSRARWMNYAEHLGPLVAEIAPYLEEDRELLAEHGIELPSGGGWLKRLVS